MRSATIVGLSGTTLQPDERSFLTEARPAGVILFARNVDHPEQVRALVDNARAAIADPDCLVLVDQEGGRVQRMTAPHWTPLPAAERYGQLYERNPEQALELARQISRLCAAELRDVGLNTNCAPCLDRPVDGAHDVIGSRAYSRNTTLISDLAQAVAESFMAAGVLPVIKHIPGHGRAQVDSHKHLPVVDTPVADLVDTDFAPFRNLNQLPAAMTAHVVYTNVDPDAPATASPKIISDVIRGAIGFDGLLMTDDLSMAALQGSIAERAQSARMAGCDLVLHCNGNLKEMQDAAVHAGNLSGRSHARFAAACAIVNKSVFPLDLPELRQRTREYLAEFE